MSESESSVLVCENNQGARRKRKGVSLLRTTAKKKRYSVPSGSNVFVPCKHDSKKNFQCVRVRPIDALRFRKKVYGTCDKQYQDQFVSRYIEHSAVKRQRPRQQQPSVERLPSRKPHGFSTSYNFPTTQGKIKVCKKFFLHLTKFSVERIRHVLKVLTSDSHFGEKRGGDRLSYKSTDKKNSVRQYIGSLKAEESHYNRLKSKRLYLQSGISIRKLHEAYNNSASPSLKVSATMFRNIFCGEFNIGFKSPASDICGFCTMLNNKIKSSVPPEKTNYMLKKRVHKVRAQAFYDLLKETNDYELTICFDMQQVQPLPRTPIQEAFYKRQLGFYNICITDVKTSHPVFFVWTEEQAGRGSTEVGSALINYLQSIDLSQIIHLRLFSDGCGGQNKNNHVLHAIMHFMATQDIHALKKISLTFPVRGHSYLPADRCFGRVEKLLRKKPTIITKEEYFEELGKVGEVKQLGEHWTLKNVKGLQTYLQKLDKISDQKRIFIEKEVSKRGRIIISVKANEFFRFEPDLAKNHLLKRGWNWDKILKIPLGEIPLIHPISSAKKKDVDELLSLLYDQNWKEDETLSWYKNIVVGENIPTVLEQEHENEDEACCCLEDDEAMHI